MRRDCGWHVVPVAVVNSTDISAWATAVLAVVAMAAFWATLRALRAAQEDNRQARYARIDARAPRVIVREAVPPALPGAIAQKTITPVWFAMAADQRFDLPGHSDWQVELGCYVELVNEGTATAFVRLPPGAIAVSGPGERPPEDHRDLLSWALGRRLEFRLDPSGSRWILLQSGRSIEDWVQLHRAYAGDIFNYEPTMDARVIPGLRFTVDVEDQFAEGVHDRLIIEALALPLTPIEGSGSAWQPTFPLLNPMRGTNTGIRVQRTHRDYAGSSHDRNGRANLARLRRLLTRR